MKGFACVHSSGLNLITL